MTRTMNEVALAALAAAGFAVVERGSTAGQRTVPQTHEQAEEARLRAQAKRERKAVRRVRHEVPKERS